MKKLVVALGGNAILSDDATAKAQQKALEQTAEHLVNLIKQDYQLIISHGNGPQVGNLLLQQQAADSPQNPALPLDTCVAMTQGSIGYWMVNALNKALKKEGIDKKVAAVVTQVVVDAKDPAFEHPTKPIGPFLTEEEAKAEMEKTGAKFVEDAGRGWRKVVPSPKPISIVEYETVNTLVENDTIVVAAGGGGIPVVGQDHEGVEAVIDKDFASEKLADLVHADLFVVLTGVDNVYINFGKENQEKLERVTVSQMKQYIKEDQFAKGSMLPKVEAAIDYVEKNKDSKAVITSLENLSNFGQGIVGTEIVAG